MRQDVQVLVLIIFALAYTSALTPVYECDNGSPLPRKIQVDDCEDLPCLFAVGSTIVINATFEAVTYLETLKSEVLFRMLGIEINYPLEEPDGCKGLLNTQCPLYEGENTAYQLQISLLEVFPKAPVVLRITLYGEDKPQFCFMIDAEIV